jgi:hypothetical protein
MNRPKGCDAGDEPLVFVADLVGHEPHLLPLQQLALGVVGPPLHVGGVFGGLGQLLFELLEPRHRNRAPPRLAEHAVHDQVGIAADRRREVGVVLGREAEVAQAHRVVARLLHGAQHQRGNRPLLGRALHAIDEPLEVHRLERLAAAGEAVAERRDERLELPHLLRVGRLVHAVQRRHTVFHEVRGHRLVGQQHELLDEAVGDVALARHDVVDLTVLAQHDLRFRQVEVDGAAPPPAAVQDREELVHQLEERHQRRVARRATSAAPSSPVRMAFTSVYVIRSSLLMTPSCIS